MALTRSHCSHRKGPAFSASQSSALLFVSQWWAQRLLHWWAVLAFWSHGPTIWLSLVLASSSRCGAVRSVGPSTNGNCQQRQPCSAAPQRPGTAAPCSVVPSSVTHTSVVFGLASVWGCLLGQALLEWEC